jgi:UDP-N-acetylmuramate dehydrogenase
MQLWAQAGVSLAGLAAAAAREGMAGLAFASGIPGTLGGAVYMNAGAYGGEMSQVVTRVSGVRLEDGGAFVLEGAELGFSYRHSALQGAGLIVTDVALQLTEGDPEAIRAEMAELNRRRAEKQPLDKPSAGSAFKRPEGYYASALIDQCGLKGYSVGGAQVSRKHAGFLVNQGSSSADYLELVRTVQRIVRERAGVELEPEIRFLGWAETAGMPGGGMR